MEAAVCQIAWLFNNNALPSICRKPVKNGFSKRDAHWSRQTTTIVLHPFLTHVPKTHGVEPERSGLPRHAGPQKKTTVLIKAGYPLALGSWLDLSPFLQWSIWPAETTTTPADAFVIGFGTRVPF